MHLINQNSLVYFAGFIINNIVFSFTKFMHNTIVVLNSHNIILTPIMLTENLFIWKIKQEINKKQEILVIIICRFFYKIWGPTWIWNICVKLWNYEKTIVWDMKEVEFKAVSSNLSYK